MKKIDRHAGRVPSIQELADKLNELIESHEKLKENLTMWLVMMGAEPGEPIPKDIIKKKAS
jgi:hypothetical protein